MYHYDCDKMKSEGDVVAEYGPVCGCKHVDTTRIRGRLISLAMMTVCRWVGGWLSEAIVCAASKSEFVELVECTTYANQETRATHSSPCFEVQK